MKNSVTIVYVLGMLTGLSCQSASESVAFSQAAVTGTIAGSSFQLKGARAQPVGTRLDITLANVPLPCGIEPRPEAGLLRLDITVADGVPATAGAEPAGVIVAATAMKSGASGPTQSTIMIDGARFRVNGNDVGAFSGSVVARHKDVDLSGTFTATVCPAKK